ncbi:MAG: hypothetical protein K0B16_13535 [Burkholderiaceae bacterium]|nr:hypothetical protein [Burkholderiaceae bacterium]
MNMLHPSPTVFVRLHESTVATLMALRSDDETLDAVTARCADLARKVSLVDSTPAPPIASPSAAEPASTVVATVSTWPEATSGLYVASILGAPIGANTLGSLLCNAVDAIHDLDPTAIERLARLKARTRHYVAREPEQVHAGRRDLPVLQTRSGWWVSANMGRADLVRSLRALCQANGLRFGQDIRFPA